MSDTLLGALIGALAALGGGIATQIAGFVLEKRRELATYRTSLYEKRLIIHQEAYRWLMDLIEPLREAMKQHPHESLARTHTPISQMKSSRAREWWDANCLYLDDASRAQLVYFIEAARAEAACEPLPSGLDPVRVYRDAPRAVQEGIGMKHLDVKERPSSV